MLQLQSSPSLQHHPNRKDSLRRQNRRSCKCRHKHPLASPRHSNNPDWTSRISNCSRRSAKFSTQTILHNCYKDVRTQSRYQLVPHHSVRSPKRKCLWKSRSRMTHLDKACRSRSQQMLNMCLHSSRHTQTTLMYHRLRSKRYMPLSTWRFSKNTFLRWMRHQLAFRSRSSHLHSSWLLPSWRFLRHFHKQEDQEIQKQHFKLSPVIFLPDLVLD